MASTRKTMMQLVARYEGTNVKEELRQQAINLKSGYFDAKHTDYLRWLCYAALKRIEDLEVDDEILHIK